MHNTISTAEINVYTQTKKEKKHNQLVDRCNTRMVEYLICYTLVCC